MREIWKPIKDYEGLYEISSFGRVKSLRKKSGFVIREERILRCKLHSNGYIVVDLTNKSGRRKTIFVHRLVAQAFIPNQLNKPQVNHIDGNKQNNRFDNLEWCTGSENCMHAIYTGLCKNIKITKVAKIKNGEIIEVYDSLNIASRENGISAGNLCNLLKGRYFLKTLGGYEWKYVK